MRKILNAMALLVVSMLMVSMAVAATPSTIGSLTEKDISVEVNNKEVDSSHLNVDEGETLDIEVELNNKYSNVDVKGVEVVARLSGYEYSDYTSLEDSTELFDVNKGTRKFVNLELTVPKDLDNGENTLRIMVLDRNSKTFITKEYKLNVESPRHSIEVEDVSFAPSNTVKAGKALLVDVLLENYGAKDEKDVKVTVAVPKLGVSATKHVSEVEADDTKSVPQMFVKLPSSAAEGEYDVVVSASYDNLKETATKTAKIKVLANEANANDGKLVLGVGPDTQSVQAGTSVNYGLALTNAGKASRLYSLETVTGDWGSATVSENLVVLEPGQNKLVSVKVTPNAATKAGEYTASVAIKAGEDVLTTVAFKANVLPGGAAGESTSLRNGLEIALIVLVVLLVIVGLIIGFSRLKQDDEEDLSNY